MVFSATLLVHIPPPSHPLSALQDSGNESHLLWMCMSPGFRKENRKERNIGKWGETGICLELSLSKVSAMTAGSHMAGD